jgi:hypothetical protein
MADIAGWIVEQNSWYPSSEGFYKSLYSNSGTGHHETYTPLKKARPAEQNDAGFMSDTHCQAHCHVKHFKKGSSQTFCRSQGINKFIYHEIKHTVQ